MGELEGIEDPCVAVSMELQMSIISHMIPQMLMLGKLNFPPRILGVIFEGCEATDDIGVSASIFVGRLVLQWPCLITAVAVFLIEKALELAISSTVALVAVFMIDISSTAVLMAAPLTGNSSATVLMAALLIGFSSSAVLVAAFLPSLGLALIVSSIIS